ncbi:MAG: vitamin B12 transport system substrate-binding protein [Psychrosphaera sp.]|jgi:vitamin B12 transport system substrate-binding protein
MFKRLTFLLLVGFVTQAYAAEFSVKAKTVPAQRIIALAPHIVESLFDIGAGGKIVATVDYADYPKQALDIPRVGGYYGLQIEKILQLNPDLVLVWRNGNKAEDIAKLENLGLTLAFSDPDNIDGVASELRLFGALTGHEQQAEKLALEYTQELSRLRQTYQDQTPISVFYQLWSEPLMSVNKNTWIHQLIQTCGATNVFADNSTDYPQLSMENIIVAKPQLIIMPQENSEKPQPVIDWQQWSVIPAVKHNQFMKVDADLIHRFSRRMLTGLEDMCQKIERSRQTLVRQ